MPEVIALAGWPPEVMAYAFAKYSRSPLSIRESIKEISDDKAGQFLDTYYFQYGHASIADNAHVALGVEGFSQIATYEAEDEELWDGQERSTRYQKFGVGGGYLVPRSVRGTPLESVYCGGADYLLERYQLFSERIFEYLVKQNPKPSDIKDADYKRNLRARTFDVTRYFLFGGILTSFGQIVKARVLEGQISRLMSSEYQESRELGEALKRACMSKPFCPENKDEPPVAPTLVKYTAPSEFIIKSRELGRKYVVQLLLGELFVKPERCVELAEESTVYDEIISTILYESSQYKYNEISKFVRRFLPEEKLKIVQEVLAHRGGHDPLPKTFAAGYKIQFDIVMDRGGERDLHRHRNCVQIHQRLTVERGYDRPALVDEAGLTEEYNSAMENAAHTVRRLSRDVGVDAHYLIPFAYRFGTLYKMHLKQAVYVSELRSGVKGHFSYREVACQMHEQLLQRLPFLKEYARVTPLEQTDMLTR